MKALSQILILSLLVIVVFGAFVVKHESHHASETTGCVINNITLNQDCHLLKEGVEFALFHLEALKQFSSAAFSGFGVLALLLLALAFTFLKNRLGHLSTSFDKCSLTRFSFLRKKESELPSRSYLNKVSWLALFTHSPTSISN